MHKLSQNDVSFELIFLSNRQSTIDMAKTAKQQLLLAQEKHVKDVEKLKKQIVETKKDNEKTVVRVSGNYF